LPPTSDRAPELAALLPAGADRCIIARPSLIPPAQRMLVARVSQTEAMPWWPELEVVAYAGSFREHRDAPPSTVALLWVAAEPSRVRAVLDARGPQSFDWSGGSAPCETNACPARASFLSPHVLRIEHGAMGTSSSPGAEARCARMAAKSPDVLELTFARSRALLSLGLGVLPLTASSELRPTHSGLHMRRKDLMRSTEDAERAANDSTAADVMLGPIGALGSNVRRQQTDASVQTDYDLLWEDLELARADDVRMQAAERKADALERSQPEPNAWPAHREDVLAELGFRLEEIRRASVTDRPTAVQAARALLEHALERSPDDEGLALLLAELLLDDLSLDNLSVVEPVRDLVRRFRSRPGAQPRWGALRRRVAAFDGVEALAKVLVEDGLVERRKAHAVAGDIVLRLRGGAPYLEAERAALNAGHPPH
jgi:hypothetical protein